jgi:hypothetical protein
MLFIMYFFCPPDCFHIFGPKIIPYILFLYYNMEFLQTDALKGRPILLLADIACSQMLKCLDDRKQSVIKPTLLSVYFIPLPHLNPRFALQN